MQNTFQKHKPLTPTETSCSQQKAGTWSGWGVRKKSELSCDLWRLGPYPATNKYLLWPSVMWKHTPVQPFLAQGHCRTEVSMHSSGTISMHINSELFWLQMDCLFIAFAKSPAFKEKGRKKVEGEGTGNNWPNRRIVATEKVSSRTMR